jgi:fructokinase
MYPPLDAICLGELLVDFVPSQPHAPLARTKSLHIAPGGAPANVAVALRRLGLATGFIGKVGDDPFGRYLREVLRQQQLDLRLFGLTREALTRLAFVTNDSNEQQRFLFYGRPGADVLLSPDDIQESYMRQAQVFHFGSISLIEEPSRSATLAAIGFARKHGLIISFDPNLRPALWPSLRRARQEILKVMRSCHLLKMNHSEWNFLFPGRQFEESLTSLKKKGIRLTAITLGADGAMLASDNEWVKVKGIRVKAVDSTGAGDGFMAGLLYKILQGRLSRRFRPLPKMKNQGIPASKRDEALTRLQGDVPVPTGWRSPTGTPPGAPLDTGEWLYSRRRKEELFFTIPELREMARFANVVGALTCTKPGGIPAFPSFRELKKRIRSS